MSFLSQLFLFLAAALIVVPLLNRLGLSSVIGYLVAGVIIGPSGLQLVDGAAETLHFAEIGVVLLLFVIGLELQPRRLWVMRRSVFGLGSAQVLVATVALAGGLWGILALPAATAWIVGFALALSSTAFVLQLLAEQKALNQPHGRAGFGVLLFQDIAVIPAIVILTALGGAESGNESGAAGTFNWLGLLLVGVVIFAARLLLKPALRFIANTGIHELFIAASLAIVCGAALLMHAVGLSMGLGAFIAGMLVAD
ncbi:MAG: cation:proton antiporter, partial [Pseudomonadota bacterium]